MSQIKIDQEFSGYIKPMQAEEFEKLKANIITDGCRDPLVIWAETGILIDGHNRYRICSENDLDFKTVEMSFADRDSVFLWIIDNQMGRRNLQPIDKVPMLAKRGEIVERQARERQACGQGGVLLMEKFPEAKKDTTRDQLGAMIGVSGKTFSALKTVVDHGDPEIIDAVRSKVIGADAAAKLTNLPKEEQIEILNTKKAAKKASKSLERKKRTKKEIDEQRDIDKNYSAESRQLFDLAIHQMKRIRDTDKYGIIVLKEMKKWCNGKIKTIKRACKL